MNFVEFIENRFQEVKLKSEFKEKIESFDVVSDSKIKSLHSLLTGYRALIKWLFYPVCLADYILVNLHLRPKPKPVLLDMIKKQKEEEARNKKIADEILANKDSSNVTPIIQETQVSEQKES